MTLKTVFLQDEIEIIRYTPSLSKPFYINMEPLSLFRRCRFAIDYLYGYHVYYLSVDNSIVGYCTITSGKNPRFWFANKNDIIIGPYYIDYKHRNKGLTTFLVDTVIHKCHPDWQRAYVYILNDNLPSIHVTKKVGGSLLFHVHNTFYRKLVKRDDGEYGVYEVRK